ncbi:MAG: hypothetical protein AVDCRST_MAG75-1685 [uncultured Propionibacteriaceae bacterium]|uniref:Peptidase S8/S53 domain-containing protein n=1 Tax=uncultured Propionibacteriaceae bacterium TaxID=257457 RepID=A0A6J4NTG7_9ACTN|nr:MAG: hypothetical protein AVDCRST_MAG75-1685 [uncultured Propionibacteriaceae bacterium]
MTTSSTAAPRKPVAKHVPLVMYEEDEIIVAQQHERVLRRLLKDKDVEVGHAESSDVLGLAKLRLTNLTDAEARLAPTEISTLLRGEEEKEALAEWQLVHPRPNSDVPIDQILWALRAVFAARCSGWTPTLGKNRFVGQVHGVGEVIHGGGGDPQAVDKADINPFAAKARDTAPGSGVRVGVLDTGIHSHAWLAGSWTAGIDDTVTSPADSFADGHATFITGLVLSQAPGATVRVRKVLENGTANSWDVAKAIVEFGNSGLDVLNLSFACYTEDGEQPMALAAAIDRLDPNLVVVAAAGNHGEAGKEDGFTKADNDKPAYPAAFDDVIAVGAANDDGKRASFSPNGWWLDLNAPGDKVTSTYLPEVKPGKGGSTIKFRDSFARWSGTSFAAALVTGAVAAKIEPGHKTGRQAVREIFDSLASPSGEPDLGSPEPPFLKLWPPS